MGQSQTGNGITDGVIWKQLLLFFFPILFGTFFQQLYNTADAVIVGRFVGKEALAAVGGSTSVLINLLVNLFVGVSSGATVVVAQAYGAHEFDDVTRTVHTSVALAITAGGAMTVIGLVGAPIALRAMGTPEDILGPALTYMRVYMLGIIASFLYNIGSAILRAVGDTRRPLYFLIVSCLINIALDLLLVVKLGLGVLGVGIATVASQVVSAVLVIAALRRADAFLHLSRREIRFTGRILKGILKVGIPAGLQSDMYSISNIILQSCINAFGTNVVAAWAAFGKIDGFFWMIMSACGISITTFVGQNFGAQKYTRIRKGVRVCLGMSFGTAVFVSAIFCIFGHLLFALFTDDTQVIQIGIRMLMLMTPFYFTYICVEILSGTIRGTGEALVPMLMVCCGVCVLRIVWAIFVLPLYHSIDTIVISYPITWSVTSILFICYYLHGGWLRKQIAKAGYEPEIPNRTE